MSEERTYGPLGRTLEFIETDTSCVTSTVKDLAAHLRKLLAENAAMKSDAERLEWLLWKLPGDVLRSCVGELADTADGKDFRISIDSAMKDWR